MAQFLGPAFQQALDASAVPYNGGLLYVYETGTTTPIALFSDEDMLTPAANPVVADASGSFAPVFMAETSVKLVLKTASGVTFRTIPVAYTVGVANVLSASDVAYNNSTSGLAAETAQAAIDEIVDLQSLSQSWTSASDGPIATGTSTNSGAAGGPDLDLYRDSASPAASDVIGGIRFNGENAAGTKELYAKVHAVILDTTNGSEDAKVVIQTEVAGALADRVHIGGGIWGDGATDPGTGKANFTEVQQSGAGIRPLVTATSQATTSGTNIDFGSIPSWVKRINVLFNAVSLSGANDLLVQIGDSGGIETTSYVSVSTYSSNDTSSTSGFVVRVGGASGAASGRLVIEHIGSNLWVSSHSMVVDGGGSTSGRHGGGVKTLSDTLTQVRITGSGGNTFDAGSVTISYE